MKKLENPWIQKEDLEDIHVSQSGQNIQRIAFYKLTAWHRVPHCEHEHLLLFNT